MQDPETFHCLVIISTKNTLLELIQSQNVHADTDDRKRGYVLLFCKVNLMRIFRSLGMKHIDKSFQAKILASGRVSGKLVLFTNQCQIA